MLDENIPDAYGLGMTTLHEYLTAEGIRQADFAKRVGARQPTISRLASGVGVPSLDLAVRISRETDGKVPAESWIPSDDHAPSAIPGDSLENQTCQGVAE